MAEIYISLGVIAKKCNEYDRAIEVYNEVMNIIKADDPTATEIALNLADVYRKKENYANAKKLYGDCLKKLESLYGENHPQVIIFTYC